MPNVGLHVFPFWTAHFGWTACLNYTMMSLPGLSQKMVSIDK